MTANNKTFKLDTQSLLDMMMSKLHRLEVIDHRIQALKAWTHGRVYWAEWMIKVELSLQDDYQTLKIFISDKIGRHDK